MNILRMIFVVFFAFNLTGCFTISLSNTIKYSEYSTEKVLSDTITDVYIDKNSPYSIQLGGVNSSFLVFDDSDGLKKILSSSLMNVDNLSLRQNGEFSLFDEGDYTKVYGKVDFVYSFKNLDKANELLSNTKCQLNEMNECVFEISELSGDYNQKPVRVEEQNIIHLQKPVILAMKSILSTRLSALML